MFHVDLHSHTRFFHDRPNLGRWYDPFGVRLSGAMAARRNLDGFATTNHDYYRAFHSDGLTILPGIEISTTHGHLLVIGPDPPAETDRNALSPSEAVSLAHDRDCVAVIAHPFRASSLLTMPDVPFDAIEVSGKHPRTWPLSTQLAAQLEIPLVGGSDAHYPFEIGSAYTAIDADTLSPESVVTAIREGRVEPRVRTGVLDRLTRRIYARTHGRKYPSSVLAAPSESVESAEVELSDDGVRISFESDK